MSTFSIHFLWAVFNPYAQFYENIAGNCKLRARETFQFVVGIFSYGFPNQNSYEIIIPT